MEFNREEKINLIRMNGKAYVWTSRDWRRLRGLRILGSFVGNLATPAKQDRIAGLPLALLAEETSLLLEKGYANLVDISKRISEPPDEELRRKCKVQRERLLAEQAEILRNERKQEIASKIDVIVKGKRAKKCREGTSGEINEDEIIQEEYNKIEISKSSLSVQISTKDPWIEEEDGENCVWDRQQERSLNYLVFKDLWERGYYITPGGKFGGDYLVYPEDPIRYHAFFIVICLEKNEKLQMQEIITYGRLGHSVKKTVVLAYLDESNRISYHSIQWAGF